MAEATETASDFPVIDPSCEGASVLTVRQMAFAFWGVPLLCAGIFCLLLAGLTWDVQSFSDFIRSDPWILLPAVLLLDAIYLGCLFKRRRANLTFSLRLPYYGSPSQMLLIGGTFGLAIGATLVIFSIDQPELNQVIFKWVVLGVLAVAMLAFLVAHGLRARLWELPVLAAALVVGGVLLMVVSQDQEMGGRLHFVAAAMCVYGLAFLVCGLSLQQRWRRWLSTFPSNPALNSPEVRS